MSFPAPYERFEGEVLPEWIDYNGHMNLAYYTVLFDYATDLLFDELGLGLDYRRTTQQGTFVAETHNLYERELLVGARIRVATQELMCLHVDLAARRVTRFPEDLRRRVAAAAAAHAALPRPDWVGRRIT